MFIQLLKVDALQQGTSLNWKHIDVFDLVYTRTYNKHQLVNALSCRDIILMDITNIET